MLERQRIASLNYFLENLDNTPKSDYSLWRATKSLKRPTLSKPPLRKPNGEWARSDSKKLDLYVEHLKKVFTPNVSNNIVELPPVIINHTANTPPRFEIREVKKAINELNPKKSTRNR